MSTMIEKLEKYANNLESIVSQRTAELVTEKRKTDALLYRMLPQCVLCAFFYLERQKVKWLHITIRMRCLLMRDFLPKPGSKSLSF